MKNAAFEAAHALKIEKYNKATTVLLAGSVVRGEGTEHSDLDIVVVYDHVASAFRESYLYQGWPVEVFVHDPGTLKYFFKEHDCRSAIPSLATMVSEGIEIPASTNASQSYKKLADTVLSEGPMKWSESDVDGSRYAITNLVDDLRAPRSHIELIATATELHRALAQHIFRTRRMWMATGKMIPRQLEREFPQLANQWNVGFTRLFESGNIEDVMSLVCLVLKPDGGWLFDGYSQVAPAAWRCEGDTGVSCG